MELLPLSPVCDRRAAVAAPLGTLLRTNCLLKNELPGIFRDFIDGKCRKYATVTTVQYRPH